MGGADRARVRAAHWALPHTADAGFAATGPTLAGLFEEAARAVGEVTADVPPDVRPDTWTRIELAAADLPGLAYAWLNALIAQGEIAHGALVAADVVEAVAAEEGGCRLHGRAGFRRFEHGDVRVRRPPKSATFHGLAVEKLPGGWRMTAYLDV